MKRPCSALAVVMLLAATPARSESWYVEQVTAGETPLQVTELWSKGPWLRSESVYFGHPIQTLVRGDRYLIIDELTGTGVSVQRSPRAVAADAAGARPFAREQEQLMRAGGEKVREEKIGSDFCTLYRVTLEAGRMELCVTQTSQLPVLVRYFDRASAKSAEVRYLEWQKAIELRDDFFAPDPRVTLESYTYEAYVDALSKGAVGPAPPLHSELLHGPAR